MYRLNIPYKQFYITSIKIWLNESAQMPPVHAANLVANSGNTAYGVDVIEANHFACCKSSQSNGLSFTPAYSFTWLLKVNTITS